MAQSVAAASVVSAAVVALASSSSEPQPAASRERARTSRSVASLRMAVSAVGLKGTSNLPRGTVSGNGVPVHRARGRRPHRQGDEPGQGALSGAAGDEARPRRVLPLGRRRDRARALRAADAAAPLPGRRRGRDDLPEAGAREAAGVGRGRARHVPVRPARRRAVRDRGRAGRLGREPRGRRLPPLAVASSRRRQAGRAPDRHRPAARDVVRGRQARRGRRPGDARRDGVDRVAEDLRQPRHPRRVPDRAEVGLPGRAPLRARVRPRGRAPQRPRHDRVVEGGARRARLHRLQPERPRPHDRVRLLGARTARRDRLGAGDLGRAAGGRDRGLHARDDAGAVREARRRSGRDRRRGLRPERPARVGRAGGEVRRRRGAVPAAVPEDARRAEAGAAVAGEEGDDA